MTAVPRDTCGNAWFNLIAVRNKDRYVLCEEWASRGFQAFRDWWNKQAHAGDENHGVTILLSAREASKVAGPDTLVIASKCLVKWLSTNIKPNTDLPLGVVKSGAGFRPRYGKQGVVFTGATVATKEEAHRLWQKEKLAQFDMFIADNLDDARIVELLKERKALLQHEYDNCLNTTRI